MAGACLAGGVARLLAVVTIPTQPVSDFWVYFQGALELERAGTYSPTWFPPGYPLVIAGGVHLAQAGAELLAAKAVNILLALFSIVLAAMAGRELAGERAGVFAAFGLALFPRAVLQPCLVASENLFSPLFLLLALVCLRALRRKNAWDLAAMAGALVAGLALTRPVGYMLGSLWLVRGVSRRRRWGKTIAELIVLLAVQHTVMLPWALHNQRVSERMAFLTPVGGIDMLVGIHPDLRAGRSSWKDVLNRLDPSTGAMTNPYDLDGAARRAAVGWMVGNPRESAELYLHRLWSYFKGEVAIVRWVFDAKGFEPPSPPIESLPGEHPLKHHLRGMRRTMHLTSLGLFLLAAIGGGVLLRQLLREHEGRPEMTAAGLFFLLGALYFTLITCFFHVSDRYRWPMEDLLFPVAAVACTAVLSWRPRRTGRSMDGTTSG